MIKMPYRANYFRWSVFQRNIFRPKALKKLEINIEFDFDSYIKVNVTFFIFIPDPEGADSFTIGYNLTVWERTSLACGIQKAGA